MTSAELAVIAGALAAPGRIFLSADERPTTIDRRLTGLGLEPGPEARRAYREVLLTTPCLTSSVSAVALAEEALSQATSNGTGFPQVLAGQGLLWGVRMDQALSHLAGCPGETLTRGLGGLPLRLARAGRLGARFARWRAVFVIGDGRPSRSALSANAEAAARFAAVCQKEAIVPVISVRFLRAGHHSLEQSAAASEAVLAATVAELVAHRVDLPGVVLGSSMILPGTAAPSIATSEEIAEATCRCFLKRIPDLIGAIVLSTTGQAASAAAAHLNALVSQAELPWPVVLSSGPTLQETVLRAWCGRTQEIGVAHQVVAHRLRCYQAAARADWCPEMEHSFLPTPTELDATGGSEGAPRSDRCGQPSTRWQKAWVSAGTSTFSPSRALGN